MSVIQGRELLSLVVFCWWWSFLSTWVLVYRRCTCKVCHGHWGRKILFKILKDISSSNPLLPHLNVCLGTEHPITSYSTNLCLSPLLSGYGLPDDIVIEKQGKGDNFVDCTGANIKISNLKLIQHDAVEGILSKCKSILNFS